MVLRDQDLGLGSLGALGSLWLLGPLHGQSKEVCVRPQAKDTHVSAYVAVPTGRATRVHTEIAAAGAICVPHHDTLFATASQSEKPGSRYR